MRLIGIGDSHLQGESYAKMAATWQSLEYIDLAVPGDRIEAIFQKARHVPHMADDIVVLSAGTNDIPVAPWGGLLHISQYSHLLLRLFHCRVIVQTIIPWSNGHEDHLVVSANRILKEASEGAGAIVFDAYASLKKTDGSIGNLDDYRDDNHLSERGNCYLASLLCHTISGMLRKAEPLPRYMGVK